MNNKRTMMMLGVIAMAGLVLQAAPIPLNLPRPDGQPGNPKKPVKVYILAGQSNMVGMGDISGAKARYPTVYLSADPALIPGVIPVGTIDNGKAVDFVPVAQHGLFEAKASLYEDPAKPPLKTLPWPWERSRKSCRRQRGRRA
jgi:hypothetical protein